MSNGDDGEHEESAFEEAKAMFRKQWGGKKLKPMAERMAAVQALKVECEATLRGINAELDVLRFETIPERMEVDGVENVRYEGIGRVSLSADLRVAVKPGVKEGLFAWLKKRKLSDLIVPGINSSTLKAFVKGRMKDGKEIPTDFLNVTPITRASITKG